jgi:hypothetical protein
MKDRIVVDVPTAPAAVGPYSQAIKSGGFGPDSPRSEIRRSGGN